MNQRLVTCIVCKEDKLPSEFHNCSRKKSGKQSYCKSCGKKKRKPYSQEQLKYYKSYYNRRMKEDPEEIRWNKRESTYRKLGLIITREEYNTRLSVQDNRCAICKRHQSELKQKLSLDHNHNTGNIRGFLCKDCNIGLGLFKDSFLLLTEAMDYLKQNP